MWRERQIHSARKTDTPRCQLNSRFQCVRKKNQTGIRVRVMQLIGYECKDTKYGEVFLLKFRTSIKVIIESMWLR